MKLGDTTTCRLIKGGKIEVTLDDRVLPDRTCGQSDYGWWVFDPADIIGKDEDYDECRSYFLNDSGILWEQAEGGNHGWTVECGYSPEVMREDRERTARYEAQVFYEGKAFDRKYGPQVDGL